MIEFLLTMIGLAVALVVGLVVATVVGIVVFVVLLVVGAVVLAILAAGAAGALGLGVIAFTSLELGAALLLLGLPILLAGLFLWWLIRRRPAPEPAT